MDVCLLLNFFHYAQKIKGISEYNDIYTAYER